MAVIERYVNLGQGQFNDALIEDQAEDGIDFEDMLNLAAEHLGKRSYFFHV